VASSLSNFRKDDAQDLNTRPPLFGGEEQGPWRFASADDIIRAKQL
jgi:hypothetical protein